MLDRKLERTLLTSLATYPAVYVGGPRRSGKSTLLRQAAAQIEGMQLLELSDTIVETTARHDPYGFIAGLTGSVAIDDMQRVPELLPAIQAAIEIEPGRGRFLLAASATLPALLARAGQRSYIAPAPSDPSAANDPGAIALGDSGVVIQAPAGIHELRLWPLSRGEHEGTSENFIDAVFGRATLSGIKSLPAIQLCNIAATGAYPEAAEATSQEERTAWFTKYVDDVLRYDVLRNDVQRLATFKRASDLANLLAVLASHVASPVNHSAISREAGIPRSTVVRSLMLLEESLVTHMLPAWPVDVGARAVKSPRIYFVDTGLACSLLRLDYDALHDNPARRMPILRNLVVNELASQATWSNTQVRLCHFAIHAGKHVDVVIEDSEGHCVAVNVARFGIPRPADWSGIESFASRAGSRYLRGIVLFTGQRQVRLSPDIFAVPIPALWRSRGPSTWQSVAF